MYFYYLNRHLVETFSAYRTGQRRAIILFSFLCFYFFQLVHNSSVFLNNNDNDQAILLRLRRIKLFQQKFTCAHSGTRTDVFQYHVTPLLISQCPRCLDHSILFFKYFDFKISLVWKNKQQLLIFIFFIFSTFTGGKINICRYSLAI